MIIYAFQTETTHGGWCARTSLKKAKAARAARYRKPDRPEIFRITLPPLSKDLACKLLESRDFASGMEDIA